MKLLIIGSLILLSNLAHAGPTISPMDNDRASTLVENNKAIIKANNGCKNNKSKNQYKSCKYNINDYRTVKSSKVGCANNTNRKNSSANGDLCN
ncbi:TPA: hypothetical protein U5E43_003992 [Yersinia enterocolitica]|nr:hypothetical protein [Yersinia enterocolitica]HEN3647835.1 hypothetical protein [Yersinia enterocolitica]